MMHSKYDSNEWSPDARDVSESSDRLDEQHAFTTSMFGFLLHPHIPPVPAGGKIADVGAGSGAWLLDVASQVGPSVQLRGFDVTASAFPAAESLPPNVSFAIQDMDAPFPASEIGTYDVVAVRFVSAAAPRGEWARHVANLATLLKPGGWLQWIESCNFALYNSRPGTSRAACQQIYDGLDPLRAGQDLVIGMFMRETDPRTTRREDIWRGIGLVDVHEDVFSTDRVADPALRDKTTRNAVECFVMCLKSLVGTERGDWTEDKIRETNERAMKEIDDGVYHTLDQVCMVGRKP